ncbi:MAG: phosphatidate cytidylyltransferase [Chloroflexia bacterium]
MKRVITAAWLVPVSTYSIFFAPHWLFVTIVILLAVLCYREYARLVENQGLLSFNIPAIVGGIALLTLTDVAWTTVALLPLLALGLSLRATDFKTGFASAGAFALGVIYIFGAWRCGIELHTRSHHWLFFAVALNWVGDTGAYYCGRAFGKHKLAPEVSPAKTIEGSLGGIAASVLFGYLYLHYTLPEISPLAAILLSITGNIAGQIGDLCESALKRGAGMKDSGTMLAGHGGWLDRLDSSLFSMPAIYWALLSYSRWH